MSQTPSLCVERCLATCPPFHIATGVRKYLDHTCQLTKLAKLTFTVDYAFSRVKGSGHARLAPNTGSDLHWGWLGLGTGLTIQLELSKLS